jgi:methylase of polypeptide subunit release factors
MIELARRVEERGERTTPPAAPPAIPFPQLGATELHQLARLLSASGYAAAQDLRRPGGIAPLEDSHARLQSIRRLFWLGQNISLQECVEALAPVDVTPLIAGGLLQERNRSVGALFQIQVYDGLSFIVDFLPREQPIDTVLPIGPSGKYMASVTIRRPVTAALDMGCGCGIQALLISRFTDRVTATDINPRAVGLTVLNAELNGITNVEALEGSFFEPVGDRRFDLVVANLPYVITPEKQYVYRDLGRPDDVLIRQYVEQLPAHLTEGGYGLVMLNWIHAADQAWWRPIEDWTKQRNADGWLLYSHSHNPEEYARQWLTIDASREPAAHARAVEEWVNRYNAMGIERIGFGLLTLRRRTSQNNWRCSVHVLKNAPEPLGPYILRLFENQDYLVGIGTPSDLLEKRLRPEHMTIESPSRGIFVARTTRGFLIRTNIHGQTSRTITRLDGDTDLETAIRRSGTVRWWGKARITDLICREIYELTNLGMIRPA